MGTRDNSFDSGGNLRWYLLASIALHALVVFLLPQWKAHQSFNIYPLANAGIIELGSGGGEVGGGLDHGKGFGGGGSARFITQPAKEGLPRSRTSETTEPRLGNMKGTPEDHMESPKTAAVAKTSVEKTPAPKPQDGDKLIASPSGSKGDNEILTSKNGNSSVPVASGTGPGKSAVKSDVGSPDGVPGGSGSTGVQGVLAGPGGFGKGIGGPGGNGNSPYPGSGEGFRIAGAPPVYPKYAESNGIEGKVGIRIMVGTDGRPDKVDVTRSSGDSVLDNICVKTISKDWKFMPREKEYSLTLTITFENSTVYATWDPLKVDI